MLTLYISSRKQAIKTVDGSLFKVFPVFIKNQDGHASILQNYPGFSCLKDLQIFVKKWKLLIRLNITSKLKTAIIDFLHKYHAQQDLTFDCYSFASEFSKVEHIEKYNLLKLWKLKKPRLMPQVDDVIFLMSRENTAEDYFHHAAVYIGMGLYISVYGSGGDLEISTLKDMKEEFGATHVLRAVPR